MHHFKHKVNWGLRWTEQPFDCEQHFLLTEMVVCVCVRGPSGHENSELVDISFLCSTQSSTCSRSLGSRLLTSCSCCAAGVAYTLPCAKRYRARLTMIWLYLHLIRRLADHAVHSMDGSLQFLPYCLVHELLALDRSLPLKERGHHLDRNV